MTRKRLLKLTDEYHELENKLERLSAHLNFAKNVPLAEINLEVAQLDIMRAYLDCLKARIELARRNEK